LSIRWVGHGAGPWSFIVPGKGSGYVHENSLGLYLWYVVVWSSLPKGRYSLPVARGMVDTLEDAKADVEETLNMIDFEEVRRF